MVDTHITEGLMTIEEFIEQYDQQPFEIIDGERKLLSPTMADHGDVQSNLLTALIGFIAARKIGKVYVDTPFVLTHERQWVKGSRVPDLMYFVSARLAAYKSADSDYGHKPFVLVPDLAVEIVSPTDSYSQVTQKIKAYLKDGVRLVWVFDLERKVVQIYQADHTEIEVQGDGLLTGGDVIPGFEVTVNSLFA